MKFIVKLFPEIAIKSKPVRRKITAKLASNLRSVLRGVDPGIVVYKGFDRMRIACPDDAPELRERVVDALQRVAGVGLILEVQEYPLGDFDSIAGHALAAYGDRLAGKTFAVRCKRSGQHDFRSIDVERYVGATLLRETGATDVSLKSPEVTVQLEIARDLLHVVEARHPGPGGYPIGSIDSVLSLISGGFDSPVASYLTMKRGMRTHFLFFNLGGRDHEVGVKEVALYLWQRYGSGRRVLFISVPFEEVVAQLLANVQDSYMGVILKRMMLRAADRVAAQLDLDALVTGEAVAQVSSQTLHNLAVIDKVTDRLVLRPLIAADKQDIMRTATAIGTEEFAANMPEYCGVISVNPTIRAREHRLEAEEAKFDSAVLDRAVDSARQVAIDKLADDELSRVDVEVLSVPLADSVIIDIRHPDEQELTPLQLRQRTLLIPFYELHSRVDELRSGTVYMLYCGKGVMSRLHASHMAERDDLQVKVYAPG